MVAFLSHLRNFIGLIFETAVKARGLTMLGIILGLVAPFLNYVKIVKARWQRDKKFSLALLKPTSTEACITAILWGLVIMWALGATVYRDHQSLVAVNSRLSAQVRELKNKPVPICPTNTSTTSAGAHKNSVRVSGSITQTSHGSNSPNIVGNGNKP